MVVALAQIGKNQLVDLDSGRIPWKTKRSAIVDVRYFLYNSIYRLIHIHL